MKNNMSVVFDYYIDRDTIFYEIQFKIFVTGNISLHFHLRL